MPGRVTVPLAGGRTAPVTGTELTAPAGPGRSVQGRCWCTAPGTTRVTLTGCHLKAPVPNHQSWGSALPMSSAEWSRGRAAASLRWHRAGELPPAPADVPGCRGSARLRLPLHPPKAAASAIPVTPQQLGADPEQPGHLQPPAPGHSSRNQGHPARAGPVQALTNPPGRNEKQKGVLLPSSYTQK